MAYAITDFSVRSVHIRWALHYALQKQLRKESAGEQQLTATLTHDLFVVVWSLYCQVCRQLFSLLLTVIALLLSFIRM